jgi:hypothetical protein
MATETTTRLVDDLDGSAADRTVLFSWNGKALALDLSKKNLTAFERALKPYLAAARPAPGTRQRSKGTSTKRTRSRSQSLDLGAVRAWARENGHEVSTRGRIPGVVVEAYHAAHAE